MNQSIGLHDILIVLPMLAVFATSLVPVMAKVFNGNKEIRRTVTVSWALAGLVLSMGLTLAFSGGKQTAFFGALIFDGVATISSMIIHIAAMFCLLLMRDHRETTGHLFAEKVFLFLSSVVGMQVLVLANDFLVTFLGIETMSLGLYLLIAMSRESARPKEAAFKYFVLGGFASAIFLYGLAFVYGTVGSTEIPQVAQSAQTLIESKNRLFFLGVAMMTLGFLFKVSIFPFHFWTPDVYQGAAAPLTAFMATAVKTGSFVALFRFAGVDGVGGSPGFITALSWLAVLSMWVANTAALWQTNLKRLLAYSSIAHSGFVLVALVAGANGSGFDNAISAALFYLLSYTLMTVGAFAVIGGLENAFERPLQISDLKGLSRSYPASAAALSVLLLSMAGIPPTAGFFAKLIVLGAAVEQDLYWVAVWSVLASVIAVAYYLRPIIAMYSEASEYIHAGPSRALEAVAVAAALLVIAVGLWAGPIVSAVHAGP